MTILNKYRGELEKCSKCGFCEAFCPVYAVTGREPEVARGRNAQLLGVLNGDLSIQEAQPALSTCLLCRACVPSCYTGVKTDEIIRAGREALVNAKKGSLLQELIFNSILPYPSRVYLLLKITFFFKKIGLVSLVNKMGLNVPSLTFANALMANPPRRFLNPKQQNWPPKGKSVAYFRSCGFSYLLPETGAATIRVIQDLGYDVYFPENNCCGLPPYANGYTDAAVEMAKTNINILGKFDVILTECGSCSSQLKKYAELLKDNSEYAEKAKRLSERVMDSNEFIVKTLQAGQPQGTAPTGDRIKVTYHDPCHLGRYQGITKEPRELIKSVPGVEFIELPESDWCCGGAGAYSIVNNGISMKILDRKMDNVKKTGANILATSCPACMIQLSYGVKRAGLDVKVVHVNQLLGAQHNT